MGYGDEVPAALNFKVESLDGKPVDLSKYEGKAVLVVNVASRCGLTPQYKELQALYEKYHGEGLAVLGFPCNQFGLQEPGTAAEIRQFCTENYGVTFDMFSKIDVNGEQASPLYKYLRAQDLKPKGAGDISWNFEKFLISRKGEVVARFAPTTKPNDPEFISAVEKLLSDKTQ
ncbi:MAG: glutathione peroxidase [Planctomycetales bacterium]|nr:glutathione peroxidase [Planctomycetales bacterium]